MHPLRTLTLPTPLTIHVHLVQGSPQDSMRRLVTKLIRHLNSSTAVVRELFNNRPEAFQHLMVKFVSSSHPKTSKARSDPIAYDLFRVLHAEFSDTSVVHPLRTLTLPTPLTIHAHLVQGSPQDSMRCLVTQLHRLLNSSTAVVRELFNNRPEAFQHLMVKFVSSAHPKTSKARSDPIAYDLF